MTKKIITREGLIIVASLLLCSVTFASSVPYDDYEKNMIKVDLGMKKTDVKEFVGEPTSVVKKFRDSKGRLVEIYSYPYVAEDIMNQPMGITPYLITYVDNIVDAVEREPRRTKS